MCLGVLMARFSRRWCSCRSAGCGLEIDDLLGRGMLSLASRSFCAVLGEVTCWNVSAGPVKVPTWSRSSSRRACCQVVPAVVR